jgi:hypothetical protein
VISFGLSLSVSLSLSLVFSDVSFCLDLVHNIDRDATAIRAIVLQLLTALASLAAHTKRIVAANEGVQKPVRSDFHGEIFEVCANVQGIRERCERLLDSSETLCFVQTNDALDQETTNQVRKSVRLLHSHTLGSGSEGAKSEGDDWDAELEEESAAGADAALIRDGDMGLGEVIGGTPQVCPSSLQ